MLRQRKPTRSFIKEKSKPSPVNGKACMKYYYKDQNDFQRFNLECEKRPWGSDLNNLENYSPGKMQNYLDNHFIHKFNNNETPFQFKEDYSTKSMHNLCNTESFELNPSQKFLGMFINGDTDFTGILVYHGLGSGKTTTSIIIGEAMKSNGFIAPNKLVHLPGRSPFKVFIVAPKNVQEQFVQEIVGSIKNGTIRSATASCVIVYSQDEITSSYRQFYVGSQSPDGTYHYGKLRELEELEKRNPNDPNIDRLKNEIYASIGHTYEIMTHDRFLNMLMKTVEKDGVYTSEPVFTNPININNDFFHTPNSLLIIDEIHTLVREYSDKSGSNYRKLYHILMFYARQRENGLPAMKIVLLSGTPIYDNPHESALIINLLRPRIPFPTSKEKFDQLFISDGKIKNETLFKYMCSGYVSYFKGGNPNGFPLRVNHIVFHRMKEQQENSYISSFEHEFKKEIELSKMKKPDSEKPSTYFQLSTQKCNIAYPLKPPIKKTKKHSPHLQTAPREPGASKKTSTKRRTIKMLFGNDDNDDNDDGRDENIKNTAKHIKIFNKYLRDAGEDQHTILKEVEKWSLKFAEIVRLIDKTPGPVFIYTRYVNHGIMGIVSILHALGWDFIDSNKQSNKKYAVWSPGALETLGIIDGLRNIEPKYQDSYIKRMKTIFNSESNVDGSLCKVLISNVVEGISLRRVTQVHVCEPWWNMSEMEQIVARAIRFCSHADVPDHQKRVDVYYHSSILQSYPSKNIQLERFASKSSYSWLTVNQQMYITSFKKQTLNIQFEQALKESAIDCRLNKFGNIVRLEKMVIQGLENYNLYYDRTKNFYYSASIHDTGKILFQGVDLTYTGTKMWPANGIVENSNRILFESDKTPLQQNTPLSFIVHENIDCMGTNNIINKSFSEVRAHAISIGEDESAWQYCYDSYLKNRMLPQLIVKYDLYTWGIGGKFMDCLYKKLLHPEKYKLLQSDQKKLENFLIHKKARLQNTQRYKDILSKKSKLSSEFIENLNYPQLEILAKKYLGKL